MHTFTIILAIAAIIVDSYLFYDMYKMNKHMDGLSDILDENQRLLDKWTRSLRESHK